MFRIFIIFTLSLLVLITVLTSDIFSITPQQFDPKQLLFIMASLSAFLLLVVSGLRRRRTYAVYILFLFFPFLSQSAYYLNISSPFFIITPVFLYLVTALIFTKNISSPKLLQIVLLFSTSIIISVLIADNINTAFTFYLLGVGGFCITVYLIYFNVRNSSNPLTFIKGLILSIVIGTVIYFLIEVITFGLGPQDILNIIGRKWHLLPSGRYFTGGYKEPAGLAFVYASIFWVIISFYQFGRADRKKNSFSPIFFALLASLFLLLISGTRNAIINLVTIGICLWFLRQRLGLAREFKFKFRYLFALLLLVGVSTYYLLPRTALSVGSSRRTSFSEPTIIKIGSMEFELVGTTAMYYKKNEISFQDFFKNPLGSGPLNATPYKDSPEGGLRNYFSFISNVFVIGATFGWFSLFLWLTFTIYCGYLVFKLRNFVYDKNLYSITVVFLSILIASLLPGSYYLGPSINWSNFIYDQPLSPELLSVPAEYPAIISGVIIGCLIGLIEVQRRKIQELNPPINQALEKNTASFSG